MEKGEKQNVDTLEVLKNRKIGKCKILPSKKYFGLHRAKFGIKG